HPRRARRPVTHIDVSVYVIVDPEHCGEHDPLDVVQAAVENGATMVQLRAKALDSESFESLAAETITITQAAGVPLIINDDVHVALAVEAEGLHVGPHDLPVFNARQFMGPGAIIGASAPNLEVASRAIEQTADYLGVGAVFDARAVKSDASAPRGLEWIAEMSAASTIPV